MRTSTVVLLATVMALQLTAAGCAKNASERRAASVQAWLAAKGVEAARLTPRGFGEGKPVADNGTAEGRQRNRRVEVIIEKGR